MEDLWERAEEILAAGKPFVLATIIRTRGSVPREVGGENGRATRRTAVWGQLVGAVAKGKCSAGPIRCWTKKLPPRIVQVDLTGDFDQDEIQVCGGVMDVALDLWQPEEHRELAQTLAAEATRAHQPAALGNGARPAQRSPTRNKELPVAWPR